MQYFRSALFNLIMFVSVTIHSTLVMFTLPLPPLVRYRFASLWARFQTWVAGWLLGLKYHVTGREHLPHRTAVIMAKHQSMWETMAFQVIFPPQVWVLKRELIWIPFFGWALWLLRAIAIDRGSGRRAVQQIIEQGRDRLANGFCVVVFPEGTRVAPHHQRRFGIGGAVLAVESGHPVVPVAHNAGHYWRRRSFVKKPGTIQVVIGPAIDPKGMTAEELNHKVETWMHDTMTRIEGRTPERISRDRPAR
jgi:1-acyl-sn-glycerol-3-phosphate acyltransferase